MAGLRPLRLRTVLVAAGWLAVAGTAAWAGLLALSDGFLAAGFAVGLVFVAFATLALLGHLRDSALEPVGALLGLGASFLLGFSWGGVFLPATLLLFLATVPALHRLRIGRTAFLLAAAIGILATLPTLGGYAAAAVDPCSTVTIGPWGATSGGSGSTSISPDDTCPSKSGSFTTLDRLVAFVALFAGGAASLLPAAWPARLPARLPATALFAVAAVVGGFAAFPLGLLALMALLLLWLDRLPSGPPPQAQGEPGEGGAA